jgi:hypothetical protein
MRIIFLYIMIESIIAQNCQMVKTMFSQQCCGQADDAVVPCLQCPPLNITYYKSDIIAKRWNTTKPVRTVYSIPCSDDYTYGIDNTEFNEANKTALAFAFIRAGDHSSSVSLVSTSVLSHDPSGYGQANSRREYTVLAGKGVLSCYTSAAVYVTEPTRTIALFA